MVYGIVIKCIFCLILHMPIAQPLAFSPHPRHAPIPGYLFLTCSLWADIWLPANMLLISAFEHLKIKSFSTVILTYFTASAWRAFFFFHTISLCLPCVSFPSLGLFWQMHTDTARLKMWLGQCQLRKEPIGRWSTCFMGQSVRKKSYNDFFWQMHYASTKTPALSIKQSKKKKGWTADVRVLWADQTKKKVWDVSA